jgi:hypothetical protein
MLELSQMASLRNSMFFLKYSLKYFEPLPGDPIYPGQSSYHDSGIEAAISELCVHWNKEH